MIIVSVTGSSMRDALRQIASSRRFADAFEFRLDLIEKPEAKTLLAAASLPAVTTCRPVWEGGKFRGTEHEREKILSDALAAGSAFLDLELDASPLMRSRLMALAGRERIILSHHLFTSVPADVRSVYARLHQSGAGIVKFAFAADDSADARAAMDFLAMAKKDHRKAIALALGEAGEFTRVVYRKFGGWATYAAPETGPAAAPGQVPASQLRNVYRCEKVTAATRVFGVVGNPIRQSKGVFIHNELFRRARMNAVYCRFQVKDFDAFMKKVAPLLAGFSVTIPHKATVLSYLGSIDARAKAIGAVNTVVRRGKSLWGCNTDAPGALDAIEKIRRVRGRTLLMIGAGGAARAIAFEAKRRGATVMIANRTEEKAAVLAKDLDLRHVPMKDLPEVSFDVLVNATSAGMIPRTDEIPVPPGILDGKVVFDAVYNPPVTRLLAEAKRRRAKVIRGTEMYLNQAAAQSRLFTGRNPNGALMKRLLENQFH